MLKHEKLSKEQLRKLKSMCKEGNYEAVVALLRYHLEEAMILCTQQTTDQRYIQGKFNGLADLLTDIVREDQ